MICLPWWHHHFPSRARLYRRVVDKTGAQPIPMASAEKNHLVGRREKLLMRDGCRQPGMPMLPIVRVRAEQRATHCAGREGVPRGNDDRSRNASASV